jgi:predicted nuclease of predicted toxin-antitoxin system
VRLWIDECLSPTLVAVAQRRYEATCNEYRGMLNASDREVFAAVAHEGWVLVTNNEDDFRALTEAEQVHPGLIVLPQRLRADQPPMLISALEFIERNSAAAGTSPAAWVLNKFVVYDDLDNAITAQDWPPTE